MQQLLSLALTGIAYTVILSCALLAVWVSQVRVKLLVRLCFLTARALTCLAVLLQCSLNRAHGINLDGMIIIIHRPNPYVYGN